MNLKPFKKLAFILLLMFSAACFATNNQTEKTDTQNNDSDLTLQETSSPKDPLEPINRFIFGFNEQFDKLIFKPVAELYNKIVPRPMNIALDDFFNNLAEMPVIINDLLQANFYQATSDGWRLAINSTVGIGGIFDFASDAGLEKNDQGFGLTLAKWGYVQSNYFVVPFIGPSTIRDTISIPVYYYTTVFPLIDNVPVRNTMLGLRYVDLRARLLRFQSVYDQIAIDPYVFMRSAYLQRRAYQIKRVSELDNPYTNALGGMEQEEKETSAEETTTTTASATESTAESSTTDNEEDYYLDDA
jgi:phospholipid-binding lipoprotein MlaA